MTIMACPLWVKFFQPLLKVAYMTNNGFSLLGEVLLAFIKGGLYDNNGFSLLGEVLLAFIKGGLCDNNG